MTNSRALAEDHSTRIHQSELQRAACRKWTARLVQKAGVITVSKAREKFLDRVYQELFAANRAQLKAQKNVYMVECGPWFRGIERSQGNT